MKVELRRFKYKMFLLLIAENAIEQNALDLLCKGHYKAETPTPITGELKTDDMFNPYLSFEIK